MKKQLILILPLLIITSFSCDFDRYVGYDLEAQELLETTLINGRVTNLYDDNKPVYNAKVKVGFLEALTNINGYYQVNYVFTDDEARNKPIKISVEAHNYFPENDIILVEPISNEHNFQLRYAAPRILNGIRRISILSIGEEFIIYRVICQAIVLDYQGVANISEAYARFYYNDAADTLKIPFLINSIPSANTVHFQAVYEVKVYADTLKIPFLINSMPSTNIVYYQAVYEGRILFDMNYDIYVGDFDGFSDILRLVNDQFRKDELLFDSGL